jgi:hypothetical protein
MIDLHRNGSDVQRVVMSLANWARAPRERSLWQTRSVFRLGLEGSLLIGGEVGGGGLPTGGRLLPNGG